MAEEVSEEEGCYAASEDDINRGEQEQEQEQAAKNFSWGNTDALKTLQRQNNLMAAELQDKKRQIKELATLLEAIEPVKNMGPERYLEIVRGEAAKDGMPRDYRDVKIIDLAKKNRNLTVSLQQVKTANKKLGEQLTEMKAYVHHLKSHLGSKETPMISKKESEVCEFTHRILSYLIPH